MLNDRKPTIGPPLTPPMVAEISDWMGRVGALAGQVKAGAYIGRNEYPMEVSIGFRPLFIYIQRAAVGAGNAVFTVSGQAGEPPTSYVPGAGIVGDAVVGMNDKSFSVGVNTNANAIGVTYLYFVVG